MKISTEEATQAQAFARTLRGKGSALGLAMALAESSGHGGGDLCGPWEVIDALVRLAGTYTLAYGFGVDALVHALRQMEEDNTALLAGRVCGSPIETQLLKAFSRYVPFSDEAGRVEGRDGDITIAPQFAIGSYRVDFALTSRAGRTVVEVDGHDFHERTKEQAQRDKSRDRHLQASGWKVLRFTGSEIYRDADKCAREALLIARCEPAELLR